MAEERVLISIELEGDQNEKQVDQLTKKILELQKANKDLAASNKELAKSGQQNTAEYIENAKQIELNKQKIREATSTRKNLITQLDAEANSLKALKARNTELIRERDRISTATAEGRRRIAELNQEIDKNNEIIRENSSAMEQQRMNIGNYKSALDAVVPGLGKFIDGIEGATKASLTFIATPLGLVLGALALALSTVFAWFKRTEEGGDALKLIMFQIQATIGLVLDKAAAMGETIFKAFENPKQAIKDFGRLIWDNLVSRFEGILKLIPRLGTAMELLFEGKFKEAGKVAFDAVAQVVTGVENATDKINEFANSVADAIDKAIQQGNRLSQLDRQLGDELRALTVQRAKTELEVAKLREQALKFEGEERRKRIEEAIALEQSLSDAEVAHARTKLALALEEQKVNGKTGESRQKVAEAQAAVFQAEAQAFQNTLKFRQQLRALDEQERREREQQDRDIAAAEKQQFEDNLKFLEQVQAQRLNKIKEDYLNQLISKEEFEDQVTAAEIRAAQERLEFLQANGKSVVDEETKITDLKIKQREREIEREKRLAKELEKLEEGKRRGREATAEATVAFARQAFGETKGVAIAENTVDTIRAATRALKDYPWPFNFIVAALVSAKGIAATAQLAGITFARGGLLRDGRSVWERGGIARTGGLLRGPSHAQGGIPFSVGGRLGFEAEGGEAIINKRSTAMFRPVLSAINQAGGGVAFEKGGITRYQTGSIIASTATQQAAGAAESRLQTREIIESVMENFPPIVTLVEDIKERTEEYDTAVQRATII